MEKLMNKMEDMEMDKVAGGRCNPGGSKKRPRNSNANSMVANVDETQNAKRKRLVRLQHGW